jgi:hypothetical protein
MNDPIVRNLRITQAYHELSGSMARLTGIGANWCTVATWASKQAGQSIRREDLVVAFHRLLRDRPEAEDSAGALLQAAGASGGDQALALGSVGGAVEVLWNALNPAEAFRRTSDAVARGNRKVFEEIGALFARFLALCRDEPPSEPELNAFTNTLKPGVPPGGQAYLRQAFGHYARAMRAENDGERAQLLLLANLEIGFHEQTRLQPQIVEAMNAPVVDPKELRRRLVDELFPDGKSRLRYRLARLAGRMGPVLQARDRLAEEAQRAGRLAITAALMTLTLPGNRVLWLGNALPGRFPDLLATIDLPDLLAFLRGVDLDQDERGRVPVTDWGDLPQRMGFIAGLFRTYHLLPALFDPPFTAGQVAEIQSGRRPAGPL